MTIKQLTKVVNGRLVPSNESVDADIIEVSKEQGNAIEVKEDGLYYKEKGVADGLSIKDGTIGIDDYSIEPLKIKKISSQPVATPFPAETLQSLEEHLANLYGLVKEVKGELETSSPKIFTGVAVANADGDWSIDYSAVGFTQVPTVTVSGQSVGTAAADRRFASLNPGQPGITSCSGKLASATSAGLLAAMTMVAGAGNVNVIAIGY